MTAARVNMISSQLAAYMYLCLGSHKLRAIRAKSPHLYGAKSFDQSEQDYRGADVKVLILLERGVANPVAPLRDDLRRHLQLRTYLDI